MRWGFWNASRRAGIAKRRLEGCFCGISECGGRICFALCGDMAVKRAGTQALRGSGRARVPVLLCALAFVSFAILGHALTGTASPEWQAQQSQAQPAPQASTPAPQEKIAVEVKVVNVLATVRDKHGKTIASLTKDDFALSEDGKPQTITYFTRETDLPLRLGLLVDTSLSQRRVLEEERTASYSFLDHLLRVDKDLAFVIDSFRQGSGVAAGVHAFATEIAGGAAVAANAAIGMLGLWRRQWREWWW